MNKLLMLYKMCRPALSNWFRALLAFSLALRVIWSSTVYYHTISNFQFEWSSHHCIVPIMNHEKSRIKGCLILRFPNETFLNNKKESFFIQKLQLLEFRYGFVWDNWKATGENSFSFFMSLSFNRKQLGM